MIDSAASGLMEGIGDIYSFYYPKEKMEQFNEESLGQYKGIGVMLLADPSDKLITITRVFRNSPAEKAGLQSGDKIVYINDVYYSAYEMQDAVNVMRGAQEPLKLTVLRKDEGKEFEVVSAHVDINYVEYEILDGNIGYVIIYDFLGDSAKGFQEAIDLFQKNHVQGMIIDLRNNGGGIVDDAVRIADMILPYGTVVSMIDKDGMRTEELIDFDYYDVPIAVLVNRYSASASEILSGAIRDFGAGVLVGEKTFGKGVVQGAMEFKDGSGVQITMAKYYTPKGYNIHGTGLEPDVAVALDEDVVTIYGINNLPREKDSQLQMALQILRGEIATDDEAVRRAVDTMKHRAPAMPDPVELPTETEKTED
jgi:carboxyl-terminal processing protease